MEKHLNVKEMLCPVCGKYCFQPFTDEELEEGMKPDDEFCTVCGWNYDEKQLNDFDLKTELNSKSINEYRKWFNKLIEFNPQYNFLEANRQKPISHKCPICGKHEFKQFFSYGICPYCGWEDDGSKECDSEEHIGVNGKTLSEYKKEYLKIISKDPNYRWKK